MIWREHYLQHLYTSARLQRIDAIMISSIFTGPNETLSVIAQSAVRQKFT
jgi:hypothetical protein